MTTKYSYGTYNRLSSIGKVNFTYDGNGNTHTIANGSTTWTYSYDYNNRLIQAQKNGVTVAQYSYDGNGMLVQSVEKSTQAYAYQGDNRIYAKNTGSGSVADYFYANGMMVASVNGTSTSYYHEDALGSVRLVTSSSGTTLFSTDYKPYGTIYGAYGTTTFEYTAKPTDAVTGLYYSGARFYNPASGRFMTEDSYPGTMTDSLSQNRYIYAEDNPETNNDPTGHGMHNCILDDGGDAATGSPAPVVEFTSGGVVVTTETQIGDTFTAVTSFIANPSTISSTPEVTGLTNTIVQNPGWSSSDTVSSTSITVGTPTSSTTLVTPISTDVPSLCFGFWSQHERGRPQFRF